MSDSRAPTSPQEVATVVAEKLSPTQLVLNKGTRDGIKKGQRFLIYGHGKEIIDPITKESLGALEIVRGTGQVVHVQERLCTLLSDMSIPAPKTIKKATPNFGTLLSGTLLGSISEIEEVAAPEIAPFKDSQIGDFARQI